MILWIPCLVSCDGLRAALFEFGVVEEVRIGRGLSAVGLVCCNYVVVLECLLLQEGLQALSICLLSFNTEFRPGEPCSW